MLDYNLHLPTDAGDEVPVLVLLHGRGSDKDDLMSLRPYLPKEFAIVTPRAPHPGAPWGYGGGYAWYQFLGGTTPEPTAFESSAAAVAELIRALPEITGKRVSNVVTGGFSQGGTTALGTTVMYPELIQGLMVFSSLFPTHLKVQPAPESLSGLAVFWGHGTIDEMIPFANGQEARKRLTEAGANVTARDYTIGHQIDGQELADASAWLAQTFAARVAQS